MGDETELSGRPGLDWADTYRAHAPRLTRLATLMVGAADAHDLVTEAVLRGVSSRRWPEVEQPGAFLVRTMLNLAEDGRRRDTRREHREDRVSRQARPSVAIDVDVERMLVVRSALDSLSPSQMAVMYLHFWEDLTLEQAADQLGMRLGTVRTHFERAKRRLRVQLADEQGAPK